MIWIINAEKFAKNFRYYKPTRKPWYKDNDYNYEWLWYRKTIKYMRKTVYLDLNNGTLFRIKSNNGRYGYGQTISAADFISKVSGENNKYPLFEYHQKVQDKTDAKKRERTLAVMNFGY